MRSTLIHTCCLVRLAYRPSSYIVLLCFAVFQLDPLYPIRLPPRPVILPASSSLCPYTLFPSLFLRSVLPALFRLLYSPCPVPPPLFPPALFCLPYSPHPVPPALFTPALFRLLYSPCPVPPALLSLPCSACLIPPALFRLPYSPCPVPRAVVA